MPRIECEVDPLHMYGRNMRVKDLIEELEKMDYNALVGISNHPGHISYSIEILDRDTEVLIGTPVVNRGPLPLTAEQMKG